MDLLNKKELANKKAELIKTEANHKKELNKLKKANEKKNKEFDEKLKLVVENAIKTKQDTPVLIGRNKKFLSDNLATRSKMEGFLESGFMNVLPNPDPILFKLGRTEEAYTDILNDGPLYQNIGSRKAGTLKRKWELQQNKTPSNIYQELELIFKNLDITEIAREILDVTSFGWNVLEIIWKFTGKYWYPDYIEAKPRDWFGFSGNDNSLQMLENDGSGYKDVPDYKFLVPTYEATYENPYGTALLGKCYWNSIYRRLTKQYRIVFVEKYGMPWIYGTFNKESLKTFYSAATYTAAATQLRDDLENMVADGVIVASEGIDINIISPGSESNINIYDNLLDSCKAENAETILGHTGTAMSTPGKLGSEKAAIEVRDDIVKMDSKLVEGVFDTLIKWIYELNFNTEDIVSFKYLDSEKALLDFAERDLKLYQTGVRFEKEYYQKRYNLEDTDFEIMEQGVDNQSNAIAKMHYLHPEIPESEIYDMFNMLINEA